MKAIYKLNENEIKEQNRTIEKYTKLIDGIKDFQDVEIYRENMKVYTETIEKAKNLIENGLYAVVSLPSGVFQPYSGVKTSVLLFDNEVLKRLPMTFFSVKFSILGSMIFAQFKFN